PLREPVVRHGPFVMSDEGQVVAALQRFQAGGMGRLSARAVPAPLPDFQEPRTRKKDPS
ncbi:pirin, partial [Pelomonas sp. HMWF004]